MKPSARPEKEPRLPSFSERARALVAQKAEAGEVISLNKARRLLRQQEEAAGILKDEVERARLAAAKAEEQAQREAARVAAAAKELADRLARQAAKAAKAELLAKAEAERIAAQQEKTAREQRQIAAAQQRKEAEKQQKAAKEAAEHAEMLANLPSLRSVVFQSATTPDPFYAAAMAMMPLSKPQDVFQLVAARYAPLPTKAQQVNLLRQQSFALEDISAEEMEKRAIARMQAARRARARLLQQMEPEGAAAGPNRRERARLRRQAEKTSGNHTETAAADDSYILPSFSSNDSIRAFTLSAPYLDPIYAQIMRPPAKREAAEDVLQRVAKKYAIRVEPPLIWSKPKDKPLNSVGLSKTLLRQMVRYQLALYQGGWSGLQPLPAETSSAPVSGMASLVADAIEQTFAAIRAQNTGRAGWLAPRAVSPDLIEARAKDLWEQQRQSAKANHTETPDPLQLELAHHTRFLNNQPLLRAEAIELAEKRGIKNTAARKLLLAEAASAAEAVREKIRLRDEAEAKARAAQKPQQGAAKKHKPSVAKPAPSPSAKALERRARRQARAEEAVPMAVAFALLSKPNNVDQAVVALRKCYRALGDAASREELARRTRNVVTRLRKAGRADEAVQLGNTLHVLHPHDIKTTYTLAMAKSAAGDRTGATRLLTPLLGYQAYSYRVALSLAEWHLQAGQPERSVYLIETYTKAGATMSAAHNLLEQARQEAGEAAANARHQQPKQAPAKPEPVDLEQEVWQNVDNGNFARAEDLVRAGLRAAPRDLAILLLARDFFVHIGEPERALKILTRAEQNNAPPEVTLALAQLYANHLDSPHLAATTFQKIARLPHMAKLAEGFNEVSARASAYAIFEQTPDNLAAITAIVAAGPSSRHFAEAGEKLDELIEAQPHDLPLRLVSARWHLAEAADYDAGEGMGGLKRRHLSRAQDDFRYAYWLSIRNKDTPNKKVALQGMNTTAQSLGNEELMEKWVFYTDRNPTDEKPLPRDAEGHILRLEQSERIAREKWLAAHAPT